MNTQTPAAVHGSTGSSQTNKSARNAAFMRRDVAAAQLPDKSGVPRPAFNPWPVSIIAFFTVAIIGCATFIVFCSRHPADLVAADYYEQEIRYQGQIDGLRHAKQGTQTATVSYNPNAKLISISLPQDSLRLNPAGKVQLYRPSAVNLDRQFMLELNPNGIQTIDASNLLPGLWKVRVSWTVDRQDYFVDQAIVITAKSS